MYDVEKLRGDFPILSRTIGGKPLVYLDNAATSQKPRAVIDALVRYYETGNANIHRGVHTLAEEATRQFEGVRVKTARFLGAPDPREIVFTRNTTEGINLVAHAWGTRNLFEGDEILVTGMEHHSNLVPWHLLARRTGARVRAVPVRDDGRLDLDALQSFLRPRVRLVAIGHVSNVLGTINPVKQIARWAHDAGAAVLVDGAQAVPHLAVDVADLDADFYAFSGHKMLGPMGIGATFVAQRRWDEMGPFLGGGDMIREVRLDDSTYADPPHRWEAGTPNVADVIGLGAAIDYLEAVGLGEIAAHGQALGSAARAALAHLPGVRLLGPGPGPDSIGSVVSFVVDGVHPHDVASELDRDGIAVRAGHHCAQPLMVRFGLPATTRASFYLYNTLAEVDALVEGLGKVIARYAPGAKSSQTVHVDDHVHVHVHDHVDDAARTSDVGRQASDAVLPDDDLFREVVMDHYLHPAGREPVEGAQVEWFGRNPLCGDEVTVRLRLKDDRIDGLQVTGHGCSVSVASGSMLASELKGRTMDEANRLLRGLRAMFKSEPLPPDLDLGDMKALEGIRDLPVRVKCALLPWTTFEEGVRNARKGDERSS